MWPSGRKVRRPLVQALDKTPGPWSWKAVLKPTQSRLLPIHRWTARATTTCRTGPVTSPSMTSTLHLCSQKVNHRSLCVCVSWVLVLPLAALRNVENNGVNAVLLAPSSNEFFEVVLTAFVRRVDIPVRPFRDTPLKEPELRVMFSHCCFDCGVLGCWRRTQNRLKSFRGNSHTLDQPNRLTFCTVGCPQALVTKGWNCIHREMEWKWPILSRDLRSK